MFLRLFMLIIKPSDKILKSRSNGALNTFRIELYDFILKRLLKSYSHYAISDTVLIESKGVKLIHEYRDMEFENELSRNKISFLPSDRTGNRRFLPIACQESKAEVFILDNEEESREYIRQMWAEVMEIWRSGRVFSTSGSISTALG